MKNLYNFIFEGYSIELPAIIDKQALAVFEAEVEIVLLVPHFCIS